MTPRQDPYRVLGLVPGATAGEVRSAYRRLAKLNHPDTAGERSLPRFLAIKAAYEELVDGEGMLRSRGWPGGRGPASPRRSGPPANGASRDAWRARQAAGSTRTGEGAGSGSSGGAASSSGAGASSRARAGRPPGAAAGGTPGAAGSRRQPGTGERRTGAGERRTGAGGRATGGAATGGHRQRTAERRTARPGSTTYDEAVQPLDPSWEGGAWYGASSGSYWTLNPREYADPRKHGPEYQERARRAAQLEAARRARAAKPAEPAEADESGSWPAPAPSPRDPLTPDGPLPSPLPRHRRAARRPSAPDGP